jgi:hypothetical protein
MINKNDLRIGNYLESDGRDLIITGHYLSNIERGAKIDNPIPLTEEWLLNFGFKDDTPDYCKDNTNLYWQGRYNYVYMGKRPEAKYFRVYRNPESDWNKKDIRGHKLGEWMVYVGQSWVLSIKYFHELQNFFHIITGEELTLSVT